MLIINPRADTKFEMLEHCAWRFLREEQKRTLVWWPHNSYSGGLLLTPQLISHFSFAPALQDISSAFGEHLIEKQLYEQAALILARAGIFEKALDAFVSSGSWQQALCMASRLGYTKEKLSSLARTMAGRPWEDGSVQTKTDCSYFCFVVIFAENQWKS